MTTTATRHSRAPAHRHGWLLEMHQQVYTRRALTDLLHPRFCQAVYGMHTAMAKDGNLQGQTSHPRRGSRDAAASDHCALGLCVGSLTAPRSVEGGERRAEGGECARNGACLGNPSFRRDTSAARERVSHTPQPVRQQQRSLPYHQAVPRHAGRNPDVSGHLRAWFSRRAQANRKVVEK